MRIFFYGLFMDERLLATKGITPTEIRPCFLDGYGLRIGERATLVRRPDSRAYGVMMDIAPHEAAELYADDSVADYVPQTVIAELADGTRVEATCYNLPADKVTETNRDYAARLLDIATRLGFPDTYLDQIRQARS